MSAALRIPAFVETVRFRLSLAFAVVVFLVGSAMVTGVFVYENSTLMEPVIMRERVVEVDPATGEVVERFVIDAAAEELAMAEKVELAAYRRALDSLRNSSFLALAVLFFSSFVAGWFLSGWALKPIRRMTSAAQEITGSNLGKRIAINGPHDELRAMGDTFDSVLDRLEVAFDDQRRFVAETSHELRNPLAVARTNLELALSGGDDEEIREAATIAHQATQRMSGMVDDLLGQAREALPVSATDDLDLSNIAEAAAVDHRAAAQQRGIHLELNASPALVKGDKHALRRAANNLLANAIRLAPENSSIEISVANVGGRACLAVTDEGPGLSDDERTLVFDRFWQGTGQRGRGAGLGLAIVQRIAERHGGTAEVAAAGSGSRFAVSLPLRS